MTLQDYCIVNGRRYSTGTVFIIDFNGKHREASFICCIPETNRYRCKIDGAMWFISEKDFQKKIVKITNKVDSSVHMPVNKTKKDTEIDGLFLGWLWYIFLMVISTIFYARVGLWIFISVVFFDWRARKIKEEGTYIEW